MELQRLIARKSGENESRGYSAPRR